MADDTAHINALIPRELRERLELKAHRSNRTLSGELRVALTLYLEGAETAAEVVARHRLRLHGREPLASAELHERAERILAAAGKPLDTYTAEDYSKALEEAQRDLDDAA